MRKVRMILFIVLCSCVLIMGMGTTFCSFAFLNREEEEMKVEKFKLLDFKDMGIDEVQEYAVENGILLEVEYQYSNFIEKDKIIYQSLESDYLFTKGETLKIVVSKGAVPASVYQEYGVNELGDVPIMMYHGIVSMLDQETEYIGGNVDKDGYNRTSESFRKDLEFYYQSGYRMIRLSDYIDGNIEVELGYSPIVLTFDDGSENNFKVLGEEDGELVIDPDCAVGILEEFKKKYPDYNVTATFFVNSSLFQQEQYNEKILKWLIQHGYDVGNHTVNHVDFTRIDTEATKKEVGGMYQILDHIIPEQYVSIVALPFGSPYNQSHSNYEFILKGDYSGETYETKAALRVGWEAELSCFHQDFHPQFLKRIRAYDNLGNDFDIEYNFQILEKSRYISDGDSDTIVLLEEDNDKLGITTKRVRTY